MDYKDNFNNFYKENFEKCFMNPENTYPVSNSRLMEWLKEVEKSDDNCYRKFGLYFAKYLTHVSFTEFYEQLRKICIDLLIRINTKYVVLIIAGTTLKSNLWVSLLCWKFLKDKVTHVIDTDNSFKLYEELRGNREDDISFIHPDDCVYTGNQLTKSDYGINRNLKPVLSNMNYYICCPYISKNFITNNTKLKYPDNIIIIDTIGNYINNECQIESFYLHTDKYAIYFDHKIADSVSVFDYIFN